MRIDHTLFRSFVVFLFIGLGKMIYGQEIPEISHFTKDVYDAQNQNWGIVEAEDGRMYFANSKGLLEYDGAHWRSFILPDRQIVRAIARAEDGKIYTGGYASFGYWEPDSLGQLQYISLSHLLESEEIEDEEIWNILILSDQVIFQSFAKIFLFKNDELVTLRPPSKIMFLARVYDQVIIPTIEKGLYTLRSDNGFEFIKGSEVLYQKKVAAILPFGENSLLIGTQGGEIFSYREQKFYPIENDLSKICKNFQLNKGLRLKNGNYIFGTVLQGLFETDDQLNVLRNINQEAGLQNNTILSLYENQFGNLWVGMDKGIDLIELGGDLSFYNDVNGRLGTVYTAILKDDYFYAGTNQGVFYKKIKDAKVDSNTPFQLLDGSQGQVWQLKIIDGQLFCGHNSGTFIIEGNQIQKESPLVGGWSLIPFPSQEKWLIQGTYTGLAIFKKADKGQWKFTHKAEGFNFPLKKILFDEEGLLWGISPHKNLFSFQLSEDLRKVKSYKEWTKEDGLTTIFALDITLVQNKLVVKSGDDFLSFDHGIQEFKPFVGTENIRLSKGDGNFKLMDFGAAGHFKIYPNHVIYYHQGKAELLKLTLVPRYENIIQLDEHRFLFCLDNGYALLDSYKKSTPAHLATIDSAPLISKVSIGNQFSIFPANLETIEPLQLKPHENQITFYGSLPYSNEKTSLEYLLEGTQETWANFSSPFSKEFNYLPPGDYKFVLRKKNTSITKTFSFSILPKWYQTTFFKTFYWLFSLLLLYLFYKIHLRRLERQRQKLEEEREKQLERQHIAMKNKQLENEVMLKSEELANSTMNLIKKNEFLLKIKENIKVIKTNPDKEFLRKGFQKLESNIDKYLTNEEDWKLFESNFNQVHETFLRKLKEEFPQLTPGDLKLAAYLKMNLASKEIAPLLNISLRSVENKRHRLRQKLQITSSTNLTEFLMRY